MARIEYTEDAIADLEKIDPAAQRAILKAIRDKLGTEPEQFGDQLGRRKSGNLTPFRKLKVGQNSTYRVVYHVHREPDDPNDPVLVIVWIIAKRSDEVVYRDAMARIEAMSRRHRAGQAVGRLQQMLASAWQR